MQNNPTLPVTGFLRLPDVLIFYPVSKSTWWKGVQEGKFPAAVRIGERAVAWRAEDIRALIEKAAAPSVANEAGRPVRAKMLAIKRMRSRMAKAAKQRAP